MNAVSTGLETNPLWSKLVMMGSEPIAIIGGGLCGLVCAIALAKRQLLCTAYEKGEEDGMGGAISIEPNGVAVLDHLGVLSRIVSVGQVYDGTFIYSSAGDLSTRTTRSPTHPSIRLERPIFHQTLLHLAWDNGITVLFDHELVALNTQHDTTQLTFANGAKRTAQRVIAADGIHSTVRRIVLPNIGQIYER